MDTDTKQRIAVVGAGPAGLSAADELEKTGKFQVIVFEASPHVGGRMSTRVKNGLAFDRGANFFVDKYANTKAYAKELGLGHLWQPTSREGEHYTVKDGKLCLLSMSSIMSILKFDALSYISRARLLWTFYKVKEQCKGLNFFDLTSLPAELNSMSAYEYIDRNVGKDAADYIVDAFTSMYQFHSAKEISLAAMLALMNMIASDTGGFTRYHTPPGQMSTIPEAMAKKLKVITSFPIEEIRKTEDGKVALIGRKFMTFDKVVIATTADRALKMLAISNQKQKEFLEGVEYASTINVSFQLPKVCLEGIACVAVPYCENKIISEYTNEATKGVQDHNNYYTLINIGLHEGAAREMMDKPDAEIFRRVREELYKICPNLKYRMSLLRDHDLERWPAAMPKFSKSFVDRARAFWQEGGGQGDNGVYFAGDMTGFPWVEGAFTSGKKVAALIAKSA